VLEKMSFFSDIPATEVQSITYALNGDLDYTLTAVSLSKKVNAVSKMQLETMQRIWSKQGSLSHVISITNAQSYAYWHDEAMYCALNANDDKRLIENKRRG
jgi:starch phosphorylase